MIRQIYIVSSFLLLLVASVAAQPAQPLAPALRPPARSYRLAPPELVRPPRLDYRPVSPSLLPPPGVRPAPRPLAPAPGVGTIGPAFEPKPVIETRAARDTLVGRKVVPAPAPEPAHPAPAVRAMDAAMTGAAQACRSVGCASESLLDSKLFVNPQSRTKPGAASVQVACPTCTSRATAAAIGPQQTRVLIEPAGQPAVRAGDPGRGERRQQMESLLRNAGQGKPAQLDRRIIGGDK